MLTISVLVNKKDSFSFADYKKVLVRWHGPVGYGRICPLAGVDGRPFGSQSCVGLGLTQSTLSQPYASDGPGRNPCYILVYIPVSWLKAVPSPDPCRRYSCSLVGFSSMSCDIIWTPGEQGRGGIKNNETKWSPFSLEPSSRLDDSFYLN